MVWHRVWLGGLILITAAATLSGCGGDNDGTTGNSSVPRGQNPGQTTSPPVSDPGNVSAPPDNSSAPSGSAPTVSASALDTYAGGPTLVFSSDIDNTQWTLSGAGTLSSTSGATVSYAPPSTVQADAQVTLTASAGGPATRETITLHAPKLNPMASQMTWYVGDGPITLTVSPQFTAIPATWAVSGGGALDSTQGNTVHYTPPAVLADADAVVSVSSAGDTESLRIALNLASEKTLQLSQTSIQAGSGTTITLTVPSTIAHDSLVWTASSGTVVGAGDSATYSPPSVLDHQETVAVTATDGHSAPFVATIVVTPNATLSVSPSGASTSANGPSVSLTATTDSSSTVTWSVTPGKGTVTPSTGPTVSFTANPADTTPNDTALVTATVGDISETVTISLNFQPTATFDAPDGVAVDNAGNVYVADEGSNLTRKITREGQVSTLTALSSIGSNFLAVDSAGILYMTTSDGEVYEMMPNGTVSSLAQFGFLDDITVDSSGTVYVADWSNPTNSTVDKITPSGQVTTLAGFGADLVYTVAVDPAGTTVYVNTGSGFVYKVNQSGVATLWANAGPGGMRVDGSGNVYVIEGNLIRIIAPNASIRTLAGSTTSGFKDGTGTTARFNNPIALDLDSAGNVYVTDQGNNAIRMVTPSGVVSTIAGNGTAASQDGTAVPRPAPTMTLH